MIGEILLFWNLKMRKENVLLPIIEDTSKYKTQTIGNVI